MVIIYCSGCELSLFEASQLLTHLFIACPQSNMGDSLEELIPQTKALVGALISKPKMADKLLNKPPFRFLHDTVSAITNATGFAEGLYNEQELDSGSISDKHAKIAYLEKIFCLVGICKVSGGSIICTSLIQYGLPIFYSPLHI